MHVRTRVTMSRIVLLLNTQQQPLIRPQIVVYYVVVQFLYQPQLLSKLSGTLEILTIQDMHQVQIHLFHKNLKEKISRIISHNCQMTVIFILREKFNRSNGNNYDDNNEAAYHNNKNH